MKAFEIRRIIMKYNEIKIPHDHGQDYEKLLEQMPDSDTIKSVSDILKQLCDPTRLRIFWLLCHCEKIAHLTCPGCEFQDHHENN